MAKILLIGDPHLRVNKLTLAIEFLTWLNKLIDEKKPDVVVNLGDSMHDHAVIRSEALNELMTHIYHVVDSGIPYVYLVGNHDFYLPKDDKYHALLPFKNRIPGLHVVDSPQDLFGMTFVPYQVQESTFPRKTLPICIAHQTFLGADYGEINAKEGIDPAEISADIIISGHVHKRHTLNKVVYVGSPYAQESRDVNQVKGISIFDTDTYEFEFHQTPLPMWRSLECEISDECSADDLHSQLTNTLTDTDNWALTISGPKAEVTRYIDSKEYKLLVRNKSVRLKTNFTDKLKKKVSINSASMEHVLSEFVNKVYSGALPKDLVLSKAQETLDEVRLTLVQ